MGYAINKMPIEPKPPRLRVEDGRLIFQNGVDLGAVYQEVDGYYVFWPEAVGSWEAWVLRDIADLLDKMNQPWDDEVREFFEQEKERNA